MSLVPIGQFSKMTRLSVKALRLYDEKGLLVPAEVDDSTGYRYYELGQANRAEAVRLLRSVEVPLDQIQELLSIDDSDEVHRQLVVHRERLASRLAAQERMLAYLELLIQRKDGIMPYEVEIRQESAQQVAAVKVTTSLRSIAGDIGQGFGTLMQGLGASGVAPAGAPLIVYHSIIDENTDGDIEICVPVAAPFGGAGDVYGRELEGADMATAVHHGPYEEISPAYHTLTGWIAENGREIAGPPRETYLNDPQTVAPEELLTRVAFPVK